MKKKYLKNYAVYLLSITLGFHLLIAVIIVTISSPSMQNKIFNFTTIDRITNSEPFTNMFLNILGNQIPQFEGSLRSDLETPSFYNLAFELVTGVNSNDIVSLLTQEIPGFDTSITEIYIAGEGSDYYNLPQESPPPNFDTLLSKEDDKRDQESPSDKEDSANTNNDSNPLQAPSVFIYHSHSWEAYLPLIDESVKPSDSSSIDNNENVVLVGSMLSDKLKEYGINNSHNQINMAKALNDKGLDYKSSYTLSREQVITATSQNKSINYYIDIHRDSARKNSTTQTINGKDYARLYFVVGKAHENYEENLEFATNIHKELELKYPGISKGVYLKTKLEGNGVYNQDISNKSLLIEVGGIDNNKEELNNTIEAFAEIFNEIYEGTLEVNAQ